MQGGDGTRDSGRIAPGLGDLKPTAGSFGLELVGTGSVGLKPFGREKVEVGSGLVGVEGKRVVFSEGSLLSAFEGAIFSPLMLPAKDMWYRAGFEPER